MTPRELVARYPAGFLSAELLRKWRCKSCVNKGPGWVKIGGKVVYRLSAVEEWERQNER
jgi:hypothetical protein